MPYVTNVTSCQEETFQNTEFDIQYKVSFAQSIVSVMRLEKYKGVALVCILGLDFAVCGSSLNSRIKKDV